MTIRATSISWVSQVTLDQATDVLQNSTEIRHLVHGVSMPDGNQGSRPLVVRRALWRGLSKRCPHCGVGRLFDGWRHIDRCTACGLVFERNAGDTWFFTIVGDRLPVALGVVLVYFGIARNRRAAGFAAFAALIALLVWTAPNRWGVGIALHYLSRVFWPDPADPVPPNRAGGNKI